MQQQPIVIQQQINAWWTLAAILATLLSGALGAIVGSLLTLRKQKRLATETSTLERKMYIFRTLMGTRSFTLRTRLEHVGALNMIGIEFDGNDAVLTSLGAYLFELNSTETGEEIFRRRDERFWDLLHQISRAIGYKHDRENLKNTSYAPSGYGDEWNDWFLVRKWLAELAEKKNPIRVQLIEEPRSTPAQAGK